MLDNDLVFSDGQEITGSAVSDHKKDLKKARDIALGHTLYAVCHALQAFADGSGVDATGQIWLATDDNEALGTPTNLLLVGTIVHGTPAGKIFIAVIPPLLAWEQYIGFNYVVANGPFAAGSKVKGYITDNPQLWKAVTSPLGPSF